MLDHAGYICVLDGIVARDKLPVISRNATLQRSLWPLGLDDSSVPSHHLFDRPLAWLHKPESALAFAPKGRTGVFLHLYYSELWPEFAAFLNQIRHPFDLWITHCGLSSPARKQILEVFPQAEIVQVENRGRDIWPFISFLNDGILDKYEYICKIHSKKSIHRPGMKESLLGSRWRRRALYDLLAAGRAEHIVGMFDCDPSLGIAGPQVLRVPNPRYTSQMAWGPSRNRDVTFRLARRMGMQMAGEDLDFFAGAMFWVRPVALEPIRRLNLQRDDFPDEAGQLDGGLQHAIERLFSVSAGQAGLNIADTAPLDVTHAPNAD
jgi:lipopolysaccharide biosynthesis protein